MIDDVHVAQSGKFKRGRRPGLIVKRLGGVRIDTR